MQDKKEMQDKMEEREALIDEVIVRAVRMTMRHLSSCGRVSL